MDKLVRMGADHFELEDDHGDRHLYRRAVIVRRDSKPATSSPPIQATPDAQPSEIEEDPENDMIPIVTSVNFLQYYSSNTTKEEAQASLQKATEKFGKPTFVKRKKVLGMVEPLGIYVWTDCGVDEKSTKKTGPERLVHAKRGFF